MVIDNASKKSLKRGKSKISPFDMSWIITFLARKYCISWTNNIKESRDYNICNMYCDFEEVIESLANMYNLLKKLFPNYREKTSPNNQIAISVSSILCCIGEIHLWISKLKKDKNIQRSTKYIFSAISLDPMNGKLFYILGNCTLYKKMLYKSESSLILAFLNEKIFECKIHLVKLSKISAKVYEKSISGDIVMEELSPMKLFNFTYSCLNSIFLKVVFSKKNSLTQINKDCEFCFKGLTNLLMKTEGAECESIFSGIEEFSILLIATYYLCENNKIPEPFEFIENPFLRTFHLGIIPILKTLLDLAVNIIEEQQSSGTNLLLLLNFLETRPYILQSLLVQDIGFLKRVLNLQNNKTTKFNEEALYLFPNENYYRGFLPLSEHYRSKNKPHNSILVPKKKYKEFADYRLIKFSRTVNFWKDKYKQFNEASSFQAKLTKSLSEEENFYNCYLKNSASGNFKTPIILDGCNVAVTYGSSFGRPRFRTLGILKCIHFWEKQGHNVIVILPNYCFNQKEIDEKIKYSRKKDKMKTIPDQISLLNKLQERGTAYGVPNTDYDDSYIIQFAKNERGFIISNDKFRDYIDKFWNTKKSQAKNWIKRNVISFSFIANKFIPNPDFMINKEYDY